MLAFHSFARIGEITTSDADSTSTVLQSGDVAIHWKCGHVNKVSVTFRHFKHNLTSFPHIVSFGHGPTAISAVQSISDCMKVRGANAGPYFAMLVDVQHRGFRSTASFIKL